MGLVKHLLFWPVTGPKALVAFSLRQLDSVVQRELTDDQHVKEDLMALQMQLEIGDIDETEYERREAQIMERLRETRRWRQRLGMEEEWAPLEFKGPERGGAARGPDGPEDSAGSTDSTDDDE